MINTDNYELYFFQYQEGLLDEAGRREAEAFAAQHPELAEEMALYAEAPVLTAEELTFPDKEGLHRKEAVAAAWWRYAAAAAVVVGIGATVMLTMPHQEQLADKSLVAMTAVDTTPMAAPQPESSIPAVENAAKAIAANTKATQEPVLPEAVETTEQEQAEADLSESRLMEVEPSEPQLLAQEEVPSEAPETEQRQQPEMIIRDYSDTPWGLMMASRLAERHPEEAEQLALLKEKTLNTVERIKNNKVITIIRSII